MNELVFEIKSISETEGTFTGVLSAYGVKDAFGDVVEPGAFTQSLAEKGNRIPLLWQHQEPVGNLFLTDSPTQLNARGELDLDVIEGKRAYSAIKKKYVTGLSIGYTTPPDGAVFEQD